MAFVYEIFKKELSMIFYAENAGLKSFPESFEDAAEKWSSAFDKYASQVTPPSITSSTAKEAFKSTFLTMTEVTGKTVFPKCFKAYCDALAPGMAPNFTSTPPIGIPIFDSVTVIGMGGGKSSQCIELIITIVDAWIKTGIAINTSTGVSINWV